MNESPFIFSVMQQWFKLPNGPNLIQIIHNENDKEISPKENLGGYLHRCRDLATFYFSTLANGT
ncbi:hypothetical protein DERP_002857 [Dermatophagoides pteronyssinus]|uniref:Uncharacterized protein n=1 Tax=Dermatophagoides pteronyssinus TaxID=6956 RepID=A0ABQ8JW31_DERPT|nr:hypothetical protein DERP_002857 [Dermatophagoides pteronyssinus]